MNLLDVISHSRFEKQLFRCVEAERFGVQARKILCHFRIKQEWAVCSGFICFPKFSIDIFLFGKGDHQLVKRHVDSEPPIIEIVFEFLAGNSYLPLVR